MGYRPPSAGTAQTMILIGLIVQFIFALIFFFALGVIGLLAAASLGFGFFIFPIIFLVLFGIIPLFLLWVAYAMCYTRVRNGEYEGARTPTLVLAIVELLFGGVIPGIFYIIAYVKLGDAINEMRNPPTGYMQQPPMGMPYQPQAAAAPPMGAPPPAAAPVAPAAPTCPRCGRPATWVPQYGRYYCYTDSQYL